MKNKKYIIFMFFSIMIFNSCERKIDRSLSSLNKLNREKTKKESIHIQVGDSIKILNKYYEYENMILLFDSIYKINKEVNFIIYKVENFSLEKYQPIKNYADKNKIKLIFGNVSGNGVLSGNGVN